MSVIWLSGGSVWVSKFVIRVPLGNTVTWGVTLTVLNGSLWLSVAGGGTMKSAGGKSIIVQL